MEFWPLCRSKEAMARPITSASFLAGIMTAIRAGTSLPSEDGAVGGMRQKPPRPNKRYPQIDTVRTPAAKSIHAIVLIQHSLAPGNTFSLPRKTKGLRHPDYPRATQTVRACCYRERKHTWRLTTRQSKTQAKKEHRWSGT